MVRAVGTVHRYSLARGRIAWFSVLLLALTGLQALSAVPARAATADTWTGSTLDNNWSTAANWGGVAPGPGDSLVFPSTTHTTSVNDLAAGTLIASITFNAAGYSLTGNSVTLSGGVSMTVSGTNTVAVPIALSGSQTISTSDPAGLLVVSGAIDTGPNPNTLTFDATGTVVAR